MSEAFSVCALHFVGSQFDKAGVPWKIKGDKRWPWNWKTVLNSFECLINWPVFKTYARCLKYCTHSKNSSQQNYEVCLFPCPAAKKSEVAFFVFLYFILISATAILTALNKIEYLFFSFLCWIYRILYTSAFTKSPLINLYLCLIHYSTAWGWC